VKDDSKVATAEIKAEIQRIQDREKRAKQLDECKIWEQVRAMFDPIGNVKDFTDHNLTQIELTAAATAIYNKLDWKTKDKVQEYLCGASKKLIKGKPQRETTIEEYFSYITQFGVNELLRIFFLDTLPVTNVYHGIDGDAAIMMKVAEAYWPAAVESIGIAQRDFADRRAAKVQSRIAALQAQLKPAKKAKTPEASKKGKGIKALIPHCLLIPIFCLLLLSSCTVTDIASPASDLVTYEQSGDKLRLQIHSTSPSSTICHDDGRCLEVVSHYYNCISISVDPGETITVSDGVEECHIITAINQH